MQTAASWKTTGSEMQLPNGSAAFSLNSGSQCAARRSNCKPVLPEAVQAKGSLTSVQLAEAFILLRTTVDSCHVGT